MTDERRYREEEVRQIFEAAAREGEVDGQTLVPTEGPTLAELQAIGGEVDLAPERIADAARALDRSDGTLPRRTHFGMPVAVGRIVDLPRAPTEREWELLVGELRATFGARGRVRSEGGLREWSNGNLHACIEPTETGHRLRLGTLKGNALAMTRMGLFGMGWDWRRSSLSSSGGESRTVSSARCSSPRWEQSLFSLRSSDSPAGRGGGRSRWSTSPRAPVP